MLTNIDGMFLAKPISSICSLYLRWAHLLSSCSGASRLLSIVIINYRSCDAAMWKPQVAIRAWSPSFMKLLLQRQLEFHHSIWSAQEVSSVCAHIHSQPPTSALSVPSLEQFSMPGFPALPCLFPSNLSICKFHCKFHKINGIGKVAITVIVYCR